MDVIDYVIMGIGCLLIIIGLMLFINGKRDTENSNQVEGFGIKLNVSNPSIMLIVFGIGLLLVPRLLPNQPPTNPGALSGTDSNPPYIEPQPILTEPKVESTTETQPRVSEQSGSSKTTAPTVWLPSGTWTLSSYELNGLDQSQFVQANMTFDSRADNQVSWNSNFVIADGWGNIASYFYQGNIIGSNSGYVMTITNTNDPSFTGQNRTALIMKMENNQQLHMEYNYSGSSILLHWIQ